MNNKTKGQMTMNRNNDKNKLINHIHLPNSYLGTGLYWALREDTRSKKYVSFLK